VSVCVSYFNNEGALKKICFGLSARWSLGALPVSGKPIGER